MAAAEQEVEKAQDVKVAEGKVKMAGENKGSPILMVAMFAVNTVFLGAVGFLLYQNVKKMAKQETVQDIVEGMKRSDTQAAKDAKSEADKLLDIVLQPIETLVVNLSGDGGARYLKIDMELELSNGEVTVELEKRKPQIRDIIITLLSSKTYDQLDSSEDKEFLREEIRNTINGFLVTGKVQKVYFSQFVIS